MGAQRYWRRLPREDAEVLADRWWAMQEARIRWLARELSRDGLTFGVDEVKLLSLFAWLVRVTESPRQDVDAEPPVWWVPDGQGLWDLKYGLRAAVAADAISHAFEQELRLRYAELFRVVGPLTRNKLDMEGENEPGLALPDAPSDFMVFIGTNEGAGLGSSAAHQKDYPRPDVLVARFNSFLARVETSHRLADATAAGVVPSQEPTIQVERNQDDPDYRWELMIDPLVANEQEEQVRDYVEAVGMLPGVTEAYHQDREQILIAGRITKRALLEHAETWWSQPS